MGPEKDCTRIEKHLRRLSIAASVIATVLVVQLLYSVLVLIAPEWFMRSWEATQVEQQLPTSTAGDSDVHFGPETDPRWTYRDFHEWSHDRQIREASVIARIQYQESEGTEVAAIVVEILKQAPDTTFYYEIGDEVPLLGTSRESGRHYGDGEIMYFVGNPATHIASVNYYGERIPGRGDMSIDQLKDAIRELQSSP